MEKDKIIEMEVNVDKIFDTLCELDREYTDSLTNSSNLSNKGIIDAVSELDFKMSLLSGEDKAKLAQRVEELIKDGHESPVVLGFYEALSYLEGHHTR